MHRLFEAVQQDRSQVPLLQSALWFIGEYGDLLAESYDDDASIKRVVKNVTLKPVHYDAVEWKDVLGVLQTIGGDRSVLSESLSVLLTTLLKLSDRFGDEAVEDIKEFLGRWRDSSDAELKQRANEYFILLGEDVEAVLNPLLDRMPPLDIDTAKMLRKENELNAESEEEESEEEESEEEEEESDDTNPDYADLLGLNEEPKSETPSEEVTETATAVPETVPETAVPETMSVTAYDNHGITVIFKEKSGGDRGEIFIKAIVTNGNTVDAEELSLQLSVPRYIQLQMKPLSSDVVPANQEGSCSQMFRVRNNMIDEKNTVVKLRVVCRIGEEAVDEVVMVDQLLGNESGVCSKQSTHVQLPA